MNTLFLANNGSNGNIMMIVMLVILVAVTYFGMIRPQRKQQQRRMQMMDTLKKGDRVILVDGLHGKIDSINNSDKTVVVDADGILLTFSRMAIRQILPQQKSTHSQANQTQESEPAEAEKKKTENGSATAPKENDSTGQDQSAPKAEPKKTDKQQAKTNKNDE